MLGMAISSYFSHDMVKASSALVLCAICVYIESDCTGDFAPFGQGTGLHIIVIFILLLVFVGLFRGNTIRLIKISAASDRVLQARCFKTGSTDAINFPSYRTPKVDFEHRL
jgi:hypothetical protein